MDLPNPGIELLSPALAGGFFTTEPPGKHDLTGKQISGQKKKKIRKSRKQTHTHTRGVTDQGSIVAG